MIDTLIPLLFAVTVVTTLIFFYRLVTAVPAEDRTFADRPPALLRRVWILIEVVNFYVGPKLSVAYRERTLRRLRKAELDYAVSPQQWFSAKIVFGALTGVGFLLLTGYAGFASISVGLVGLVLGFFYLDVWLRDQIRKVEIAILKNLPNFLDMLTLCIESGCNLTVAITVAVEKTPDSALNRAFARLLREIRSGRSRVEALTSLEQRLDMTQLGSLTSSLIQAGKTGASLGAVLRAQSSQRTSERFLRAEKLAMEAPVKMLGPLILCIFPCTFVVIGFPLGVKMMGAFH